MRVLASALMLVMSLFVGFGSAAAEAHAPYFSEARTIVTSNHGAVSLKLLHGDGVLSPDPVKAVVVDEQGTLLAASPTSATLHIFCDSGNDACVVYDDLTRTVYEPNESEWQNGGMLEENGKPQRYPEAISADFGFANRPATIIEAARFELTGLSLSWKTTGAALAWWTLFWLLLRPVARYVFGWDRPLTIERILPLLIRTVAAILMIPITAYAWLQAPYSVLYLVIVVGGGALAAQLMSFWHRGNTLTI